MRYFISLLVVIVASCSPVKVRTSYDKSVNFGEYKTWCWLQGCELLYEGPGYLYDSAMIENIGNAIALEMFDKGLTQLDDQADLLVDFHIIIKEDSALFARVHEEDLPYWEGYNQDYYHFLKGTMVVDIIDRKAGKVIWRSSAERYMALQPDTNEKLVKKAVKRVLKKFPPTALQAQN